MAENRAYSNRFLSTGQNPDGSSLESFFLGDKTTARMLVASCSVETALLLDEFAVDLDTPMREAKDFYDAVLSVLFYYTYGYLPQPLKQGAYLNPTVVEREREELRAYKVALGRFCNCVNGHIFKALTDSSQMRKRASDIRPALTVSFINPNISGPSIFSRMGRANYPVAMPEILDFVAATMSYRSGWRRAETPLPKGEGPDIMYNTDMSSSLRDPGLIVPILRTEAGTFSPNVTSFAPWINSPLLPSKAKTVIGTVQRQIRRGVDNWSPVIYNVRRADSPGNVYEGSFVSVYMSDEEIGSIKEWPELRGMMSYSGYDDWEDFLEDHDISRDPALGALRTFTPGFPGLKIDTVSLKDLQSAPHVALSPITNGCVSSASPPLSFKPIDSYVLPFDMDNCYKGLISPRNTLTSCIWMLLDAETAQIQDPDLFKTPPRTIIQKFEILANHRGTGNDVDDEIELIQEEDLENGIPQANGFVLKVQAVDSLGGVLSAYIFSYGDDNYTTGRMCVEIGAGNGLQVRVIAEKKIPLSFFLKAALINQLYPNNDANEVLDDMELRTDVYNEAIYRYYTQLRDLNYQKNQNRTIPALYSPVDPEAPLVDGTQEYWMSYPPCALKKLRLPWAIKSQQKRSWVDVRKRREWLSLGFPDEMLNGVDDWPKDTPIKYKMEFFEILKLTPTDTDAQHALKFPGVERDSEMEIAFEFRTIVPENLDLARGYRWGATLELQNRGDSAEKRILNYQIYVAVNESNNLRDPQCERIWENRSDIIIFPRPGAGVCIPVLRKYCHFTTSQYIRTFADTSTIKPAEPYVVTTPLHPEHFPISRMALSGNYGGQFNMVRNKTRTMINISQENAAGSGDYRKLISSVSYNKEERECDFTFLCTPSDLLGSTQEIFDLDQYEVTTNGGVLNAVIAPSIIELRDDNSDVVAVIQNSWGIYSVLDIRDSLNLSVDYVVGGTTYSIDLPAGATPKQVGSRTHLILNSTLEPVVTSTAGVWNRTSTGREDYVIGDTVTQELGVILSVRGGDRRIVTFEITHIGGIGNNVVTGVRLQGAPRFHNFPGWTDAGSPFITIPLGGKAGLRINFAALDRGRDYQVGDEFEIEEDYIGDNVTRNAVGVVMQVGDNGEVLDAVLRDEGEGYGRTLMVRGTKFKGDVTNRGANAPDDQLKVRLSLGIQSGDMVVSKNAIPPHQNAACVWERLERMGLNLESNVIVGVSRILVRPLDIGKAKMGSQSVPSLEPIVPFVVSSGGPNNFATSTMPLDLLFQRYLGNKTFLDLRNAQ